jgi:hypothetical protein
MHKNHNLLSSWNVEIIEWLLTLSLQDFFKLMSQTKQPRFSLAINVPCFNDLLTARFIFRTQYDVANENRQLLL